MRVCIRVDDRHDKQSMTDSQGTANTPAKKKRSRIVTVIAWCVAGLLVPACGAWVIGRGSYWFDVIASQQMLISWVALVVTIAMLLTRRKAPTVVCAVLVVVSFYPVLTGRVWSLPEVDLSRKPEGVIRIITSNTHPQNDGWSDDLEALMSYDADVLMLIEVHPELSRSIRNRHYLDNTLYPHWAHRWWVEQETSPGFIISRWPIEQLTSSDEPGIAQNQLYARIEHPEHPFIAGLLHPLSPRTQSRWANGNFVIESQRMAMEQLNERTGLSLLIGADLNAGPAQRRADILRAGGLRMSKPVLKMNGSFPIGNSIPRALRVQLDDVWSRGNLKPVAWGMVRVPGSDHLAVVVDFEAR